MCEGLLQSARLLPQNRNLSENQFCTRAEYGNSSPCYDDEGGPLVVQGSNLELGVLSNFDPKCMLSGSKVKRKWLPFVYINMSSIRDFVERNVFGLEYYLKYTK